MRNLLLLFTILIGFAIKTQAQVTTNDLQGYWTLSSILSGDTTLILSQEEMEIRGESYLSTFPLQTTSLSFTGNSFVFQYYTDGERSWYGTFSLNGNDLQLDGQVTDCSDCGPKLIHFIINDFSANQLTVDLFSEDYESTVFARYTFNK